MYIFLLFFIPALSFASVIDNNNGFNDILFMEGFKTSGQASSPKEDINTILEEVFKNPDKLISDTFYVPDKLKGRVLFWANIYATYPLTTAVIHDKNDPSVIYDVMDLASVFNDRKLSPNGKEARFNKMISERKKSIKRTLKEISDLGGPANFFARTADERKIKKLFSKNIKKNPDFKDAWQNVRVQLGQKNSLLEGLKNSFKYLPIIEDIFKENGLPWELTRIPFVESSFNIKANSKVGAKGIWQIMGETGKNFMETEAFYDERYSPFKATAVAAKILKGNYEMLKSWPLAVTAYNHGPGGLKNASKQLKTKDIATIVSKYKGRSFGFASQNFYSEFLAALYVTVYYEKIFGHIEKGRPLNFYYVTIQHNITISEISNISGLSSADIASYNPEFSKKMLNGELPVKKGSKIKLPPRASYKVEDYFVKISDKTELEKELNINESEDDE